MSWEYTGRKIIARCPECNRKTTIREIKITEGISENKLMFGLLTGGTSLFFSGIGKTHKAYECNACGSVMEE